MVPAFGMSANAEKIPFDKYVLARITGQRSSTLDQEGCKWVVVIRRSSSPNKVNEFGTGEFLLNEVVKWGHLPINQ